MLALEKVKSKKKQGKEGTELLTLLFVFRGGIVMLALEKVKSKKKHKVRKERSC